MKLCKYTYCGILSIHNARSITGYGKGGREAGKQVRWDTFVWFREGQNRVQTRSMKKQNVLGAQQESCT